MTDLDRRSALIAAMLAPLAASACSRGETQTSSGVGETPEGPVVHDMSDMPASWTQDNQIAMLVYPRMTILDLIGPQYMFASLMGATVHLVAKTRDPLTSDTGVTIVPTATFDEVPRDLAVLFAPGGTDGTLAAMRDDATREFMADRGSRATYVTSVCTGVAHSGRRRLVARLSGDIALGRARFFVGVWRHASRRSRGQGSQSDHRRGRYCRPRLWFADAR